MPDSTTKRKKKSSRASKHVDHAQLLAPMSADAQDLPFLGHARAVVIVCTCAKTSPLNLSRTIEELGVDGLPFQQCVFGSVTSLKYVIDMDDIPDAPNTKLIDVVDAIQNAPKRP